MGHDGTNHPGDPGGVAAQASVQHGDTINETDTTSLGVLEQGKDPYTSNFNLSFPTDVNNVGEPGVESDRPHIDFTIEQYNGSQFTKSKGILSEVETGWNNMSKEQAASLKAGKGSKGLLYGFVEGVNTAATKTTDYINNLTDGFDLGKFINDTGSTINRLTEAPSSEKTGSQGKGTVDHLGNIRLYLPHSIQEQFAATWTDEDVNLAGAIAIGGVNALADVKAHLGTEMKRIAGELGGTGLGSPALANVLMRQDGMAMNNHLEAFFKGVGFRKFTYTFQLAPKSKVEAVSIQKIIKAFKAAAAPALATPGEYYGRFFKYPNQFKIKYWNGSVVHKISTCVLESIAVNYSAGQSNMTFKDARPLQTDLTLNFKELEIMHKAKIDEGY